MHKTFPAQFHRPCVALALLPLLASAGCDKPERPHPQGPGVTTQAQAKTLQEIPKPKLAQGVSKLSAEQQSIPVATIAGRTLTLGDLEARLENQPEAIRTQFATVAKRREFLLAWVQHEVLADEAAHQGLDRDPEVLDAARQLMVRRLLEQAVVDKVKPEDVTAAEVQAYFDANLRLYKRPASVEARHLQVADMAKARKLRDEIVAGGGEVPAKIVATWDDYVTRHTEDPSTRDRLGALGVVWSELPPGATAEEQELHRSLPEALRQEALKLEAFALSQPVQSERGIHLLLVVARNPALDVALSEVEPQIRARLLKRKRDEARSQLIDALVKAAKVEVNEAAVALLPAPAPKQVLPKAGGAGDGHDHHGH